MLVKMTPEAAMQRAIELSLNGFPAPNPRVGCVIVKSSRMIGEGWHEAWGMAHAEVAALDNCTESFEGADVYVTLEPCNHHGRTPPCSEALIHAGVGSVTFAVADPNEQAQGGADRLRSAGIAVSSGLLAHEAAHANHQFLHAMAHQRPFVTVKSAVTADGFAARLDGTSKWITGESARADGHRLRAERGCVLVGRGTIQADDSLLTSRIFGVTNQPTRVVLDPGGKLSGNEKVFSAEAKTVWLVRTASRPEQTESDFSVESVLSQLFF
ncbi:bifunctional diaminohydroxyphosphoribosylaminopyrimidine deaminase/5-amino-6-(5-phosphoribosylamino)uracil reductase RibD [Kamptonema cortianum]|nr:bifunctional diaminohydroxyphosphoribosylaminopyrimidine deaminase/5-amino-6-(5-phosphoribosylamino)uracil reductase RibD [Geitlerinema splendidum]MDK3162293.1 bifunctional diaminohydroxyphosphoribosylaminopyrimidine deaminase/5-amino-6-(5-phosphoribosylamino)uracil reductase RibD [Kamptonema cortianum]